MEKAIKITYRRIEVETVQHHIGSMLHKFPGCKIEHRDENAQYSVSNQSKDIYIDYDLNIPICNYILRRLF